MFNEIQIISGGILWLFLCGVVSGIASDNEKSGVGFFFLALFFSPFIGVIVAAIPKSGNTCGFKVHINIDSIVHNDEYVDDSRTFGDWKAYLEKGESYMVVSSNRAYEFLLLKLREDNKLKLRENLIDIRQGKILN